MSFNSPLRLTQQFFLANRSDYSVNDAARRSTKIRRDVTAVFLDATIDVNCFKVAYLLMCRYKVFLKVTGNLGV
jgi:hypothetical protein